MHLYIKDDKGVAKILQWGGYFRGLQPPEAIRGLRANPSAAGG